jgi:hypothetical protein
MKGKIDINACSNLIIITFVVVVTAIASMPWWYGYMHPEPHCTPPTAEEFVDASICDKHHDEDSYTHYNAWFSPCYSILADIKEKKEQCDQFDYFQKNQGDINLVNKLYQQKP